MGWVEFSPVETAGAEPTSDLSQEGSRYSETSGPLPSWEGPGVGRFMERMERLEFFIIMTRLFTVALFPSARPRSRRIGMPANTLSQLVCHRAGIGIGAHTGPTKKPQVISGFGSGNSRVLP